MPLSDFFRLLLPVAWAAAVLFLSLLPDPPSIDSGPLSWDKLQHAAAFGLLALLAGAAVVPRLRRPARGWLLAFAIAVFYGALIEVAQVTLTEERFAEWGDLLADVLGAGAVSLAGLFGSWLRRGPISSNS